MPVLRLTALVRGTPAQVFEHVSAYGPSGPVSEEAFRQRYGKTLERQGNIFTVQEEGEDPVTWRCTFEHPRRRTMESVDARWADRRDTFLDAPEGTRWIIQWRTQRGGLVGILQWLNFNLWLHKRFRRDMVDPVVQHFQSL